MTLASDVGSNDVVMQSGCARSRDGLLFSTSFSFCLVSAGVLRSPYFLSGRLFSTFFPQTTLRAFSFSFVRWVAPFESEGRKSTQRMNFQSSYAKVRGRNFAAITQNTNSEVSNIIRRNCKNPALGLESWDLESENAWGSWLVMEWDLESASA